MPFNGSGTFSIVNTFVPNTTILSAAVNQNFTDIATGLSDCLTRDNQAGMTAIFRAVSGSVSAPGITFNSDTTAGLYLSTTGVVGLVAKSLGLLVNSSIYSMSSVTVQSGGSGYAVGDTITETGGTAISQAVLTVATLSGSAVATATVTYPGFYTVKPSDPVAQGSTSGSGTGATFNITWTTQYTRSVVTDESGALPWQRLAASSFVSSLMAKANAYDFARAVVTAGSGLTLSNSTNPPTLTATLNPSLVPNYISGLTLSAAGGTGTFGIAAGVANDSTNVKLMQLSSAYTKTTASWAVGSGNGGIDTGSIATNTWYHVFEICRVDTGVVDIIFSLSAAVPTLPTNYTLYRRIGSMKTDGSSQWIAFTQTGNDFILGTMVAPAAVSLSTTGTLQSLATPTAIVTKAFVRILYLPVTTNGTLLVSSPQEADQAPATGTAICTVAAAAAGAGAVEIEVWTNTTAQIRFRATTSTGTYAYATFGWRDLRGQQ